MADRDQDNSNDDADQGNGRGRIDMVSMVALAVGGIAGLVGFAAIFPMLWGSEITDPQAVLRIASQQYIDGNFIVAGDLASTVRFDSDPDVLPEDGSVAEDEEMMEEVVPEPVDAMVMTEEQKAAQEAAMKAEEEEKQWIQVRDFIVGAGNFTRAMQADRVRERRKLFHEAVKPLLKVKRTGFPAGRETEGERMLGESYYYLGQFTDAIDPLRLAVDRDPTFKRRLLPLIAETELRIQGIYGVNSLATIDEYLSDPSLSSPDRWRGEIIRLRSLILNQRYDDVRETVAKIKLRSGSNDRFEDNDRLDFLHNVELQSAVAEVTQVIEQYGKAPQDPDDDRSEVIDRLRPVMDQFAFLQREASSKIAAMASIWKGRALICMGELEAGIGELTGVRQLRPFRGESIVGGLEEIEWLANQGNGLDLLQTIRYVMRELGDQEGFDTSLVSFDEFEKRIVDAIGALRANGDFANAIDAARTLPPVLDTAISLTEEALTYQQWGEETLDRGTDVHGDISRSASQAARAHFRAAGDAFAQAAKREFDTPLYVPKLWSAIEAYQQGRHFSRSIVLLKDYERYEERNQLPRAMVAYGRALLAEGRTQDALEKFETCIIEYERDPLVYDARLLAAEALIEQEQFGAARTYLERNLNDGDLSPDSPAWRDSLFTLGEMLFQRAYHDQLVAEQANNQERRRLLRENQPVLESAILKLDRAVSHYWPSTRSESASYMSARAHALAARWPRIESQAEDVLEAARRSLRARAQAELEIALNGFTRLKKHLARREEDARLPAKEQRILRNCYMSEAQTLQEMKRFDEAASGYRTVELRYSNEPMALEAILGRANCLRELGELMLRDQDQLPPAEARDRQREASSLNQQADLLVQQANVVLKRIPSELDSEFEKTTRFDREGWRRYLGWMTNRLGSNGDPTLR